MSLFIRDSVCSLCHKNLYYEEFTEMFYCGCGFTGWIIMKPNMRVRSEWKQLKVCLFGKFCKFKNVVQCVYCLTGETL